MLTPKMFHKIFYKILSYYLALCEMWPVCVSQSNYFKTRFSCIYFFVEFSNIGRGGRRTKVEARWWERVWMTDINRLVPEGVAKGLADCKLEDLYVYYPLLARSDLPSVIKPNVGIPSTSSHPRPQQPPGAPPPSTPCGTHVSFYWRAACEMRNASASRRRTYKNDPPVFTRRTFRLSVGGWTALPEIIFSKTKVTHFYPTKMCKLHGFVEISDRNPEWSSLRYACFPRKCLSGMDIV